MPAQREKKTLSRRHSGAHFHQHHSLLVLCVLPVLPAGRLDFICFHFNNLYHQNLVRSPIDSHLFYFRFTLGHHHPSFRPNHLPIDFCFSFFFFSFLSFSFSLFLPTLDQTVFGLLSIFRSLPVSQYNQLSFFSFLDFSFRVLCIFISFFG